MWWVELNWLQDAEFLGWLLLLFLQAMPEQLAAIEDILTGKAFPDYQQSLPRTQQLALSPSPSPASALKVAIEGDPVTGHFCIRFASPGEASQAAPHEPPPLCG